MEYKEYIVLDRVRTEKQLKQQFDRMFRMPKGFNAKDEQRIKIFGDRLRTVLKTVEQRNNLIETVEYVNRDGKKYDLPLKGPKRCDVNNAKKLAERLNVTEANISRYINGKNRSVPVHFFFALYDIFGVSPHYFAGYTENMDAILQLDDDGEIVCKDGVPVELIDPMTDVFSAQQYVHSQFTSLLYESPEHFTTITDLLYADEHVRDGGFAILRTYLDVQKSNDMGNTKNKAKKN